MILVVTVFSYSGVINSEFIRWDDDKQITENSCVKTLSGENLRHNLFQERFTFLSLTSFSVVYQIWGLNPVPYHLLSLLLHLINVVLVFLLASKLSKSNYVALFVAMLFALHPMRVESVAWISELKDVLFTCFALSSFIFYIRYLERNLKPIYFLIAAFFAFLSSFSKIQGLLIPFTFFLFDIFYHRKVTIVYFLEKFILLLAIILFDKFISWYALFLIFAGILFFSDKVRNITLKKNQIRYLIIGLGAVLLIGVCYYLYNYSLGFWSLEPDKRSSFTFFERFFLAGFALWFYIYSFFWPVNLNAVHPYPQRLVDGSLPQEYYFSVIILFLVVVFTVYLVLKKKKISDLFLFGWLFFLINISIVLHFVSIEGRLVVADRYSYLAYFGLFLISGVFLEKVFLKKEKLKKIFTLIFTGMLLLFSILTYNRVQVWKNTYTLFYDALRKNPDIPFAYMTVGGIYLNSRLPLNALLFFNESIKRDSLDPSAYFNRALAFYMSGKPEMAISDFNKVIKMSRSVSDRALVYTNIGEIYQKTGRDSLALNCYMKSVEIDSNIAATYNNRGMYYFQSKNLTQAYFDFNKAVTLDPDYADAWNNRGWVLTAQGKLESALSDFNRSIKLNPNYAMAYNNRGYLKFKKNELQGSLNDYNIALKLDSNLIEAYLNRGWIYSSSGNFSMATKDFTKVLEKIPNHQTALTNRAFAWFYLKDFKNAALDFEEAVKHFPVSAANHQNLGWFKMQMKDYSNAINEFDLAIKLDSTLINSFLNLGWIWLEKKNYKNAENNFLKVLSLNPNNDQALYWMGELNRKNGKIIQACNYFNQASKFGNKQAQVSLKDYCK